MNENEGILILAALIVVSKGPIDNSPSLGQIMAWRQTCDKPLLEPTTA